MVCLPHRSAVPSFHLCTSSFRRFGRFKTNTHLCMPMTRSYSWVQSSDRVSSYGRAMRDAAISCGQFSLRLTLHVEADCGIAVLKLQPMLVEGSRISEATMPLAEGPRPAETTLGLPMPANRLPRPMVEERDTPSGDGREPMIERKDLLRRKGGPTDSARLRLRNDRPTQHSLTHAFKMPEI